jgi:4-hydroxythreonine-4-phosphate dehydrogenase
VSTTDATRALRLAISLGDPNGIGPEVVLKALYDPAVKPLAIPLVVGAPEVLRVHAEALGFGDLTIHAVTEVPDAMPAEGLVVLDVAEGDAPDVQFGAVTPAGGRLAMQAVAAAVDLCRDGWADAMVTAPISKDAIAQAGYDVPGHTEFIARRLEAAQPIMMMVAGSLRVGLATAHVPLADVPRALTIGTVRDKLHLMHRALQRDFGVEAPRLAVLGLNPHAGDGGVLGTEEQSVIAPALAAARAEGIDAEGPFPADGYFALHRGDHDAILAMYHDQGLVPFKALAFDRGVNYTAGLPIVRTSPDHGTAYGLAGRGLARPGSMRAALEVAVQVARHRAAIGVAR